MYSYERLDEIVDIDRGLSFYLASKYDKDDAEYLQFKGMVIFEYDDKIYFKHQRYNGIILADSFIAQGGKGYKYVGER